MSVAIAAIHIHVIRRYQTEQKERGCAVPDVESQETIAPGRLIHFIQLFDRDMIEPQESPPLPSRVGLSLACH